MKKLVLISSLICMLALPLAGLAAEKEIVVGSKQFTEQIILGKMMIALLGANGFDAVDKTGLGGTMVARKALTADQIDVYMEYTGTGLMTHLKHKKPITDPMKCFEVVKKKTWRKTIWSGCP